MIRMSNVTEVYDSSGTVALDGIDLMIDEGEFVFLVGPSGSGKTTLMKLITGEVRATNGTVVVNDFDMTRIKRRKLPKMRRSLGVVFQDYRLIDNMTVYDNVAFAMRVVGAPNREIRPTNGTVIVNDFDMSRIRRRKLPKMRRTLGVVFQDYRLIENMTVYDNVAFAMRVVGAANREIRKRVPYVLELVGLEGREKRLPGELSGGEQQRVAIARALVNSPRMIVADEPTGNLDPVRSLELMLLFEKINEMGTTVLVVTHEKELVNAFSKRVIAIDNGRVISDGMGGYFDYEIE